MNDSTNFTIQLAAIGIASEEFCGRTFCGVAAIVRDEAELVAAIRATSVSVTFEPFPSGGYLLFPTTAKLRSDGATKAEAAAEAGVN